MSDHGDNWRKRTICSFNFDILSYEVRFGEVIILRSSQVLAISSMRLKITTMKFVCSIPDSTQFVTVNIGEIIQEAHRNCQSPVCVNNPKRVMMGYLILVQVE